MKITKKNLTTTCGDSTEPCECSQVSSLPMAVKIHTLGALNEPWTDGVISTAVGLIPRVKTALNLTDRWGTIKARWGVGRMHYTIQPGLYGVGNPTAESPVFVTANYKLSFDHLRPVLAGRDAWILVLDTNGINVWCAAGKGTFGTKEIVKRVLLSGLDRVVSHRKLILPQLGAPGVSAHLVKEHCGFRVIYGPVRAADLPAFLDSGLKADPEMRQVRFGLRDRLVLIPVEMVTGTKYALLMAAAFLLLGGLNSNGYSMEGVRVNGLIGAALALGAFFSGTVLGPALLPWLPGRAFSLKGAVLGVIMIGILGVLLWGQPLSVSWLHVAAWIMMIPVITSFLVMNFTGASTYTSLSGVLLEMRWAIRLQLAGGVVGVVLWITGLFVSRGSML